MMCECAGERESARTASRIKLFSSFCIYTRGSYLNSSARQPPCVLMNQRAPAVHIFYRNVRLSVFFLVCLRCHTHTRMRRLCKSTSWSAGRRRCMKCLLVVYMPGCLRKRMDVFSRNPKRGGNTRRPIAK